MLASKLDPEKIKEMYLSGMTQAQIAEQFGVTTQTISVNLKKLNVPTKPGRKRKNPPKPPDMSDDAIKDLVEKKKRKSNAPQVIDESSIAPSEISSMLRSVYRWYGRPLVRTDEECAERLNEFFQVISEAGELPTMEKMALALGTTRSSIWDWENGRSCSAARQSMIKQAKELLAAMDAELVSRNKIPQVTYIFRAKNFFGMKDQTDVLVTPNNPIGALLPEEELKKRITGDVVVDETIDAEFSE